MITSQKEQVLRHLRNHKNGITPMVAYERYGISRLSSIIFKLRAAGYMIETVDATGVNRYGHKVRYAQYRLIG